MKLSEAAEMIGCSSESIRNGAIGNFNLVQMNPGKTTTPWLVAEADVLRFLEQQGRSFTISEADGTLVRIVESSMVRSCAKCRKKFLPKRYDAVCCSRKCRNAHKQAEYRNRQKSAEVMEVRRPA